MLTENELREYLAERRTGIAPTDLAERIILAARATPQKRGLFAWATGQAADFMLPRPAYSLTAALALGLAIGFIAPLQMQAASAMSIMQTTLDEDGTVP